MEYEKLEAWRLLTACKRFERGDLTDTETIQLIQKLINLDLIKHYHYSYGLIAEQLLSQGLVYESR